MPASEATNETRLPRAVRIRAEKLNAQYGRGQSPNPADPAATAAPEAPTEGAAEPPAATVEPTVAPSPPATPAADPSKDALQRELAELRHGFSTIKGRLATIAEERRAEKAAWQQEREQLLERIRDLQAKQPPAAVDLGKHFTPEQIEALGETQCHAIAAAAQRIAQERINEAVEAAVQPLREKQAAVEQATQSDAEQRYFAQLGQLIPNYAEIDGQSEWHAWLAVEEGDTGISRQDLLTRHHTNRDAAKVAKFFSRFIAETAPPPPAPTPKPPVAPRGSGAQPAGDRTPSDAGDGRKLLPPTPKEISEFYVRASTKRPGMPGFVTDKERAEFEARLRLLSRQ